MLHIMIRKAPVTPLADKPDHVRLVGNAAPINEKVGFFFFFFLVDANARVKRPNELQRCCTEGVLRYACPSPDWPLTCLCAAVLMFVLVFLCYRLW